MNTKSYMRFLLLPILLLIASFSTAQVITAGAVSGNNVACFGSASASPNIQQFTASGSALTADITVNAPANFQVSTTIGSGYSSSLTLTQSGGNVPSTTIYVRSSAAAPIGAISGNVVLTSTGATTVNVAVSGTVNPTPNAVATPSAQTSCSGTAITTIVNSGAVVGTVYNWVRNNTATVTGIAASGTGNISGALTNTTTAPVTVTFTITPSYTNAGVTCTGTPVNATVVVNPTPTVNVVASQIKCNGSPSTTITFSGNVAGTIYDWTNNDPSIGLAATGSGNIAPFTLTNSTANPVTATITVTPSYTNAGTTCTGVPTSFTITVNPTATVDAVPDQVVCGNSLTSAISFSSPSAGFPASTIVYNWINTNAGIGLPGSGNGNITAFTATNNGTAPLVANITVTPTYTSNGVSCVGSPTTFTITVNPRATANAIANQSLCNGNATTTINFSSNYTGGSIVYNWVNNDPSIGLGASGAGNISSFTATNTGTAPVTATITVTPTYTSNAVSCVGTSSTFTITVNPTASVDAVADETLCANQITTPIVFTGPVSGTIYNWVNNNTSIGLAANGTGNIPSFTTANNLTNATTATITVRPTTANGCIGAAVNFTITVNPIATVNAIANQVLCNGASAAAINFSSPTTGGTITFNWTNTDPSIGIPASGSGNIGTFTATNTTTAPIIAIITVTPIITNNGVSCTGTSRTFSITVNPTASVNNVGNQKICNSDITTAINFSSPNSGNAGSNIVYNWVNNTPSIGLAASGTGDIAAFTGINNGLTPAIATITVTPIYTNNGITCTGTPRSFSITVLPVMTVNTVPSQVLCNGASTAAINFSSPNSGGILSYNWFNDNTSIGLGNFGFGNINSFTATNSTSSAITANITVTPVFSSSDESVSCTGISQTFTITVNPTATVSPVQNETLCANTATSPIVFSSPVLGTTYSWVNNNPSIGLPASGIGNIPSFVTANNLTNATTATITVTPTSAAGCIGLPISFTITVNPIATVNAVSNQVLCNGASTAAINFSSPTTGGAIVYNWTNSDPSIGIVASGSGNIPTFVATNATNAPVFATITVTPTFTNNTVSCVGTPITFTITVNPSATVNAVANQTLCANTATAAIAFTSPNSGNAGSNIVFNWVNNTPSIGLAASGTGNIPSFTAINNTSSPLNATITVTPSYSNNGISCNGTPRTFTIIVNPNGTVSPVANQVLCNNNATAAINFTTGNTNGTTVYNWINNTPSIGLAASGIGNIASFTATNATNASVTATITVTPTFTNGAVSCVGTPTTFTITVHPTAQVSAVPDQVLCANQITAPIVFVSTISGTTYTWVNNNPSIGLAASGSGNIPSFTTANNLTNAITATITVTPSGATSCTGATFSFAITVNPTATVNAVTNRVLCNGSSAAAIIFSSPTTGGTVTYNWTNSASSIGIAASGTGNIPTFIATNNTTSPVVATITVTPTFTNLGVSCIGTPTTFTITVNPTATVNAVANQTLCNGASTTAINFTSPNGGNGGSNVVFNWANNNTAIGLAASGTGNIPSFTVTNTTNAPITATITVTSSYTNAGVTCTGTSITFTITVNPGATVNAISNQSLCNNSATAAVNFTTTYTGGTVVYNWVNNTPSIGLAASGSGNIASFIAANATSSPVTATITVTPTFTNGVVSCGGAPTTFTITVNPTATVNAVSNQTLCANTTTTPIVFSSPVSGTTYTWVNNNSAIGLAASGTGNIPSFVTANNLTNATTATITVTPNTGNGCTGLPIAFTITVNPIATVNAVSNQVLCNGASTAAINFSSPTTGGAIVYNWTNSAPSIGIAATGSGNIPTFIATNATTTPVVATITVTPIFTNNNVSCLGTPTTFTITVNPTATVNAVANQTLCANTSTTAINFTSPNGGNGGSNVVYNWINNNTTIGLATSGSGNIPSFVATNNTNAPVTATITVTPTYTNAGVSCSGTSITFTITVNPGGTVNVVANQSLCANNATAAVNFSSSYTGGSVVYNWVNNTPSIGLVATGSGNIASFTATNATSNPVTATITVTPTFTNGGVSCVGTSSTFTITVNPTARVNEVANQTLCANTTTAPIVFSGTVSGTTYSWVNNNPAIGLVASGVGNIPSFVTTNNLTNATTATITVTPTTGNGCVGLPITFTITVNPIATINAVSNQILCNGASTASIVFSSPTTGGTIVYNWTNSATSIGLAASGVGNIPTFIAANTTTAPIVATITVTPTFTNNNVSCVGTPITFSITVNPTATVNVVANQVLCNSSSSNPITFTSPNSGNGGSNVVFNWTNNNATIGLAASGSGNIGSFLAINASTAPVTATITVTPTYTNGGVSCVGTSITFTITVNPTATVNAVANQSLCNNNSTAAVNFSSTYTGGAIVYNWVNNTPSIGLAASGSGNIASFIATNATSAPVTATVTVTPTFTNNGVSCVGTSSTFTITVNPTATVNAVANQSLCANTITTPIIFSSPVSGTTYTWVNNNPAIGLAASGVGNIPSFVTTNNVNSINATITVTPNSPSGCTGLPITFVITVNPVVTMNAVLNQMRCNGNLTDSIKFTSPNGTNGGGTIVYNWTNSAPSIGIPATGSGNINPFVATNIGAVPVIAIITVTPSFVNGATTCVGIPITFSITVNPTATVNALANQTVCAGQPTAAVNFSGAVAGTIYSWTNSNPSIGLPASGTGNIASFIAQNPTSTTITGTVTVTPNTTFGCGGSSKTFDYIIPGLSVAATSISTPALLLCDTNTVTSLRVVGGSLGTGAVWKWYKDSCGGTSFATGAVLNNINVSSTTTFYVRAEGTCNTTACASVKIEVAKLVTLVRQHWNDALFFDNSSNNYVKWQWYKNGVLVPGATLQHYSENGDLNGSYYVVATDKNGVDLITCPLNVVAGGFHGLELKVSPNPVQPSQSFKVISSLTPAALIGATLTVRDLIGTALSQSNAVTPITTMQAPSISGMYIVTLVLRNGQRYSVNMLVK